MPDRVRPTSDEVLIRQALVLSERSTCARGHNAALVVARSGVVLSSGYNGAPAGQPHCEHPCSCGWEANLIESEGWHADGCTFKRPCRIAVHAEANAIYLAARHGCKTQACRMVCTTAPCHECAKAIVQAGIQEVIYCRDYRLTEGLELLAAAGIKTEQISL